MIHTQTILLTFLLISVVFNLILFMPAFVFKTDRLTDISYSLTFILLVSLSFWNRLFSNTNFWDWVMLYTVLIWAFRLGVYLFVRINKIKKDKRFDGIRENFFKFLIFWLIQGFSVWVIMIPAILFLNSDLNVSNVYISIFGLIIWLLGISVESLADYQKFKYIQTAKENNQKRHWIDIGLWKYSRHPNYLGEITLWSGVYLIAISRFSFIESIFALVGPIYIFVIIRFFSGVPKLEQKADERFGDREDYQKYKDKTGLLLPRL